MLFLLSCDRLKTSPNHHIRLRPPRFPSIGTPMAVSRTERLNKFSALLQRRSKRPRGLNLSKADRRKAATTRRANELAIWNDVRQYRADRDAAIRQMALRHGKTEAFVRSLVDSNSKLSKSLREINPYNAFIHCKNLEANDGECLMIIFLHYSFYLNSTGLEPGERLRLQDLQCAANSTDDY